MDEDLMMKMKGMMAYLNRKIEFIEQVSLENKEYNDLYMAMKKVNDNILPVIKAQHAINNMKEDVIFWEEMKEFRAPSEGIPELSNAS